MIALSLTLPLGTIGSFVTLPALALTDDQYKQFITDRQRSPVTGYCNTNSC